jgi:hypothetical protein
MIYYRLSDKHNKFVKIEKADLETNDVFTWKDSNNEHGPVLCVTTCNTGGVFAYQDLSVCLSIIGAIANMYGVYIYPSEFKTYFEDGDYKKPDLDRIDANWGTLAHHDGIKTWYNSLKRDEDNIRELLKSL